jgi:hypothetical protein
MHRTIRDLLAVGAAMACFLIMFVPITFWLMGWPFFVVVLIGGAACAICALLIVIVDFFGD